ncbi:tetrathionate reductase family octaheme c-type cytochrome [Alisedimentitalea sp. MJ-SS2]|uniref:tetrathionate reductase family octaheme c-type cytochrome n=1 Tax=Aliisedimentitalea sp. MJ-SS2 TaxID=3049795 RepID=UPI00291319BC|nr:tetrathionate reductase family octaheme c-type cytochrome [Alisedimentitalea sp. MJ-SS2]MDU8926280.1 tetrathionate reductase family octaheme c-type cytochrome [Alisedimentitalea sp. MJ-SS2]
MKRNIAISRLCAFAAWLLAATALIGAAAGVTAQEVTQSKISTADHSKFAELEGPFATGPDVTKICLSCHTEAASQIHQTKHWNWDVVNPASGERLGKRNVINNFCGSIVSNEPRCTSCHIGYGWKDDTFDFAAQENVDCLVCHDQTGKYRKFPAGAGHPVYEPKEWPGGSGRFIEPVSLAEVAKNVGPTSRRTCGTCHFLGGGGNAVKHGDLDMSLLEPGKYLDVHMSPDRLDFTCSKCHGGDNHLVQGSRYTTNAKDLSGIDIPGRTDGSRATCESCHGLTPHSASANAKLNDHTDVLACQTCHIPAFARGGYPTKMWWDWSTAGETTPEGKPVKRHDEDGLEIYSGMKGDFAWGDHVVPEYRWFDGTVDYTLFGDQVTGDELVEINDYGGKPGDDKSRIWPFKVMRGKQAYDVGNQTLAVVHTFGKDDTAFWTNYDWDKAVEAGMKAAGAEYSGELGFVETEMAWPISHMTAPKEDALECEACHSAKSRLASVPGLYIPGFSRFGMLDTIAWIVAALTLAGVLGHGALRYWMSRKEG